MKKNILFIGVLLVFFSFSCAEEKTSEKRETSEIEKETPSIDYLADGKKIALSTKAALGGTLLRTISEKGTLEALTFCQTEAYPITDSMSVFLDAKVKRVSDKNRNPQNVANKKELDYISSAKQSLLKEKMPKPQMNEIGDKMVGYYPIVTNQLCLQCHGNPETDIKSKVLEKIKFFYPNDLAVNYGLNELRGIFVVEMDKKE